MNNPANNEVNDALNFTEPSRWPSIVNFRDLGGHLGLGGRKVRAGSLFRGAGLAEASDDDLARMAALGVAVVFDLRSLDEAQGRPDRLPAGARYIRQSAVASMDEVHRESLDWVALMDQLAASPDALAESEAFHDGVYGEMIARPQAFRVLLETVLNTSGVYFHCSAGKDRTGVASAIILRLLGVSLNDIMADYLESAKHPLPDFAPIREMLASYPPAVAAVISLMLGVTPKQLNLAWSSMQLWGGWDGFVADGLGLSSDAVTDLRARYLT